MINKAVGSYTPNSQLGKALKIAASVIILISAIIAISAISLRKVQTSTYNRNVAALKAIEFSASGYTDSVKNDDFPNAKSSLDTMIANLKKAKPYVESLHKNYNRKNSSITKLNEEFTALYSLLPTMSRVREAYSLLIAINVNDLNSSDRYRLIVKNLTNLSITDKNINAILTNLKKSYKVLANNPVNNIADYSKEPLASANNNIYNGTEEINKMISSFNKQSSLDKIKNSCKSLDKLISQL